MADEDPDPYASESDWWRAVPDRYQDHPAFPYAGSDPALPNVLLIGDSISMSYTLDVRDRLDGEATVHRAPSNCGMTRRILADLDTYLGDVNWDVIHVNSGIHDVTLTEDGERTNDGTPQVPIEEYRTNLEEITERLTATGADVIWASTTPVADHVAVRRDEDVRTYNEAAAQVARDHGVPVNDLYTVVAEHSENLWSDGVHFTDEGAAVLADVVAREIRKRLPESSPDSP